MKKKAPVNPQILVTNQGGDSRLDGGLIIIKEFFHNIWLADWGNPFIPFAQKHSNADQSKESYEQGLEIGR